MSTDASPYINAVPVHVASELAVKIAMDKIKNCPEGNCPDDGQEDEDEEDE